MFYIIMGTIILIVLVILIARINGKKKDVIVEEKVDDNGYKPNASDVNMMQGINAGGFAAKKVKPSSIPITDFKKGEPIGYKDLSHIDNSYGNQIANSNNNVK